MLRSAAYAILLLILLTTTTSAYSQTNPEFGLKVRIQLDPVEQIQPRPVIFGYDPRAEDGLEGGISNPAWYDAEVGASEEAWIQDDFGGPDLLIADFGGHYGDFTKIDIRHKPDSVSFETTYYIFVNTGDKSKTATLTWDPAQIPAIVKHINIRQLNVSSRPEVDMKTTSSYAVQYSDNSTTRKEYLELKLYYNREPSSGVAEEKDNGKLALYPNPARQSATLYSAANNLSDVRYTLVDVTGRELFTGAFAGPTAGGYVIDRPSGFAGTLFVRFVLEGKIQALPLAFE